MKKNIIVGLCLLLSIGSIKSQVTIGTGIEPAAGTLLDLKEHNGTSTDPTTTTKGLILPRVNLTDKDNLFPMFEDNGAGGYKIGSTPYIKADEDKKHVGLMVFNLSEFFMQGKGVYMWTLTGWMAIGTETELLPD